MTNKINATDLEHLLSKKYSQPEWIFLPQVRSTTGFSGDIRTADGIAINMYPSRGFEINGFEIKISRSDWLSELKKAAKAEEIYQYCDKFWLVVADKSIVQLEELPKGWGLLVPQVGGLRVVVQAQTNPNKILSMGFVCSLLRSVSKGMVLESTIRHQLSEEYTRGQKSRQFEVDSAKEDKNRLAEKIEKFEKASGVEINGWKNSPEKVGAALRRVLAGENFNIQWNLSSAHDSLVSALKEINKTQKDLGYKKNK